MFYLKCLDDNSEIDNLIKREIDCRAYFILCDSENSRLSKWVQEEENYIRSNRRIYEIIDIESSIVQIEQAISRFEHRYSAFISCSSVNSHISHYIKDVLEANGYTTFFDLMDISLGTSFDKVIEKAITKHSNEGFVVILLDQYYLNSRFCISELQIALGERKTNTSSILLVSLDGTRPNEIIELKDNPVRWIDATNCSVEQIAKKVVSFFNFYNTSYRKVYNLCWDLSRLNYKDIKEEQKIPYPLPNNIEKSEKTKIACRYILGLGVATDIDYAISLFRDAAKQGDENAAKILRECK
jgi:hypothetical protein